MTMSTKGRVTITKDVRDELGLEPYDRVEIVADGQGGAMLRKVGLSLESAAGMFPGVGLSDDVLEQVVKKSRDDYHAEQQS